MRDPKRIHRIMLKVQKVWENVPDLRYGQLTEWLFAKTHVGRFYVEDDTFEKTLDEILREKTWDIVKTK